MVTDTIGEAINPEKSDGSPNDDYINAVMLCSVLSGAILVVMGLFRLDYVVRFLSDPVMSGLTTSGGSTPILRHRNNTTETVFIRSLTLQGCKSRCISSSDVDPVLDATSWYPVASYFCS